MRLPRVIWYTAMSMDGRIADACDSLDFLETIGGADTDRGGDDDFSAFLRTVDAALVGAGTLRWLLRGGHGWPHGDIPTWLASHDERLPEAAGATAAPLRRIEGDIALALEEMVAAGAHRVWLCGGGQVAGQLLGLDRLDEVIATLAPTMLGQGPSLADGDIPQRRFRLLECRSLGGDAARLHWERDR